MGTQSWVKTAYYILLVLLIIAIIQVGIVTVLFPPFWLVGLIALILPVALVWLTSQWKDCAPVSSAKPQ